MSQPHPTDWRKKIYTVIFKADTPNGKAFDVALFIFIGISVFAVMLESVKPIDAKYHQIFLYSEWILTIAFTIEYFMRLISVRKPIQYFTSFYGIIDLLAILPTYLSLVVVGSHYFVTIRALRLLRIFRVFKLGRYLIETSILTEALKRSRHKIIVFFVTVITIVIFIGTAMYMIEGGHPESGFTSIPKAMYWAIVTITTVGFGDVTPVTNFGQFLSAVLMLMGYAIIAVPTGIVTSELATSYRAEKGQAKICQTCGKSDLPPEASYCSNCGEKV